MTYGAPIELAVLNLTVEVYEAGSSFLEIKYFQLKEQHFYDP